MTLMPAKGKEVKQLKLSPHKADNITRSTVSGGSGEAMESLQASHDKSYFFILLIHSLHNIYQNILYKVIVPEDTQFKKHSIGRFGKHSMYSSLVHSHGPLDYVWHGEFQY